MRIACWFAGAALLTFQIAQGLADNPTTSPVRPEIQRPVSPEAKVVISAVPEAKFEDLKVGDQVEVNYQEKDGVLLVSRITKLEAIAPLATK